MLLNSTGQYFTIAYDVYNSSLNSAHSAVNLGSIFGVNTSDFWIKSVFFYGERRQLLVTNRSDFISLLWYEMHTVLHLFFKFDMGRITEENMEICS